MFACWCSEMIYYTCNMKHARSWKTPAESTTSFTTFSHTSLRVLREFSSDFAEKLHWHSALRIIWKYKQDWKTRATSASEHHDISDDKTDSMCFYFEWNLMWASDSLRFMNFNEINLNSVYFLACSLLALVTSHSKLTDPRNRYLMNNGWRHDTTSFSSVCHMKSHEGMKYWIVW